MTDEPSFLWCFSRSICKILWRMLRTCRGKHLVPALKLLAVCYLDGTACLASGLVGRYAVLSLSAWTVESETPGVNAESMAQWLRDSQ